MDEDTRTDLSQREQDNRTDISLPRAYGFIADARAKTATVRIIPRGWPGQRSRPERGPGRWEWVPDA